MSAGRWLQRLSAAPSNTDAPGLCVCEIFSHQHSNTIDCPQSISRKKASSINVSSITVTGMKRIHVAAVTELRPGPSNDLGQTKQ